MAEDIPDDLVELAKAYLDTRGSGDSHADNDGKEIEKELEYWQEQVEEFEEETPMHEIAVEERDKFQERYEEASTKDERHTQLRINLLSRASTEFAPQGDWVHDSVVSALTHALTGRQQNRILIGDHAVPDDVDELSKREMVTVAKNIHAVAEDDVDSNEILNDLWEKMSTDTCYPITEVLVQNSSLIGSGDISDQLDDDAPDSPGANLRYVLNSSKYHPYYREDGTWTLSLLGEYAWQTYNPDIIEEDSSSDDGNGRNQQTSLDDINYDTGGDSNE